MDTYRMRAEAICASCRKGKGPAASWFKNDRDSFWTKRAAAMVSAYTEKYPAAAPADVDAEIATVLKLEAIDALLRGAKRR
jgi:hypothetical protein